MSKFLALIIDSLNHDVTIGNVLNPTDKIHTLLENTISNDKSKKKKRFPDLFFFFYYHYNFALIVFGFNPFSSSAASI